MAVDAPATMEASGQRVAAQGRGGWERYAKLAAAVAVTSILVLIAGFTYDEQAGTYDQLYVIAVLLQIVYETPFQPLFLIIALLPIYLAAARNVSSVALASGGLMTLSLVLPFARFLAINASAIGPDPAGFHNSLFQLAGPGHQMPQFVSIVTLMFMGGLVALFWRPRVGGLIGLIGAITMIFVWPAVHDEPPTRAGEAEVIFFGRGLLFGYYLAWAGAILGIIGQWLAAAIAKIRQPGQAPADPGAVGA
jgi:hypothetical protein